ncbi:type II secretion system GspH family protein [Patescibacteria group bacterium]|nr:type II secretion system GspH family protein [Patescibacteria group bacterium]
MMRKNKGFTLIELIVVISIIGVLASLIINNLNEARSRSRDAKRKQELSGLKTALRLYYNDYQTYPLSLDDFPTIYMKQLPEFYYYAQEDNGDGFMIKVILENFSDPDLAGSQSRCDGTYEATDYVICAD